MKVTHQNSDIEFNPSPFFMLIHLLLGAVLVLAYAPFSYWLITPLVISIWLTLLNKKTLPYVVKAGFLFGLGWFGAGISWVYVSMDRFGGMPMIVSIILMLLLCAYLALFPMLACYLSCRLSKNRRFNSWLFPSIWVVSEYLRSVVLTGFPWLELGYSQINSPLNALAPIIGETGISFILLCFCVAISKIFAKFKATKQYSIHSILILTILVTLTTSVQNNVWVTETGKTFSAALVQGNIPQELKWEPDNAWPSMKKYLDLSRQNYDADLIIWPESAIPEIEPLALDFLDMVDKAATFNNTAIITGIINYQFDSKRYFNSLIVLGKQHKNSTEGRYTYNNSNRYYKHHLLPIGEFVPFQEWLRPIAPFFNLPMSSFTRGNYVQPNLVANGLNIAPLLCFEIAFPEQLRSNFTPTTDVLLTVSNDAWFGDSHGPHQHLDIARMRAMEFGRPLLRDTNNGITATINAYGEVINQVPQFKETVLRSTIPLVQGFTPYSRFGNWPVYLMALLLVLSQVFLFKSKQN